MKNIDDLLRQSSAPTPRRELSADFTQNTLHKLAEPRRRFSRIKETFRMKFATFTRAHKPAAIALALLGTVVISGTASAATIGWPNVVALLSGQKNLSDGSRVVQVDTKNCRFITALNITKTKTSPNSTYYYRVKPASPLTNEQITQMVQGNCDSEAESVLNQQAITQITGKSPYDGTSGLVGGYIDNVITAISPSSVSVKFTMPMVQNNKQVYKNYAQTFNHIDPKIIVIDKGKQISLSDLHVGDHIALSYRATGDALLHSETTAPGDINTDETTLAIVVKDSPSITAMLQYRAHNSTDFEEVTPCSSQPTGYCNIEQLNTK